MIGTRLLLLLILFAGGLPARADPDGLLSGSEEAVSFSQPVFFTDFGRHQSFSSMRRADFTAGVAEVNRILLHRTTDADIWLRFRITNRSADRGFDGFVGSLWYDDVKAWIAGPGRTDSLQSGAMAGASFAGSFGDRYGFPLRLAPVETRDIFIRIRQWSWYFRYGPLRIRIYDRDEYDRSGQARFYDDRRSKYIDVLFIGIFLFQLLYILFQCFITRRIEYFYYTCYIVTALVYFISRALPALDLHAAGAYYGVFMQYLNNPLIVAPYLFYYRFGRHFIEMDKRLPRIGKWVRRTERLILAMITLEVALAFLVPRVPAFRYSVFVDVGILFVISIVLLAALRHDHHLTTRFFIAGSLVALFGSILAVVLTIYPWPPLAEFGAINFTKTAVMLEAMVFNTGLLFKARLIEKEKFAVQQKLMEEREAKRRIEKQRQAERDRLAADLHDDLGATLSSIGIQSDALRRKIEKGEVGEAAAMAGDISTSARETIAGMSDIVWAIKPHNDPLDKVVARMKAFAMNLFPGAGIRLRFHADHMEGMRTGMTFRKNMFLIFKEAVNNCAKYSGATEADIGLTLAGGRLTVDIHDNGRGFDETKLERVNGLNNMRERAAEIGGTLRITSAPGAGTRVVLTIDMPVTPASGPPNRQ